MRFSSHGSSKNSLADFLSSDIHRNIDRMNWRESSLFLRSRFSSDSSRDIGGIPTPPAPFHLPSEN